MNEKLSRPQFNQMDTTEKQTLMESLAARYDMTFLGLHTFDRWGQSCTTGIFKKDGREFVFVPGDTVTLGWEQFAEGLNQESREELEYLFREWEMEPQNPEEMIRESMAPVRQAAIGPLLVGRELEEINWEPVKLEDPRLRSEWLENIVLSGAPFKRYHGSRQPERQLSGSAYFPRRREKCLSERIRSDYHGSTGICRGLYIQRTKQYGRCIGYQYDHGSRTAFLNAYR